MTRPISHLIVHCSASPASADIGAAEIAPGAILRKYFQDKYTRLVIRCRVCSTEFDQQQRIYKKSKRPGLCPTCALRASRLGHEAPAPDYRCSKCEKKIWRGSTNCKSCAQKLPDRFCVDCSTLLKSHGAERCLSCHNKNQNKGKSRERTLFNVSPAWQKARTDCFERDDYICQHCRVRGGYLHAHHILSYRSHPSLRLEVSNLLTLCKSCHETVHGLSKQAAKRPEEERVAVCAR